MLCGLEISKHQWIQLSIELSTALVLRLQYNSAYAEFLDHQ
jgi:hypothetical protein